MDELREAMQENTSDLARAGTATIFEEAEVYSRLLKLALSELSPSQLEKVRRKIGAELKIDGSGLSSPLSNVPEHCKAFFCGE